MGLVVLLRSRLGLILRGTALVLSAILVAAPLVAGALGAGAPTPACGRRQCVAPRRRGRSAAPVRRGSRPEAAAGPPPRGR